MKKILEKMAQAGRHGDSQLVHMRNDELQGLGLLSQVTGNQMTINPTTGLPEAFSLPSWVLPAAAIALTAGAAAPAAGALGASAAVPAAEAATQAGLLAAQEAGLGASALGWGGAQTGLQGGLNSALGSATGSEVGGLLGKGAEAYNSAAPVLKPIGQGVQAAQSLSEPDQQIPLPQMPQMPQQPQTGAQNLAQLVGQNNQQSQGIMDEAIMRRQKQKERLAQLQGYV